MKAVKTLLILIYTFVLPLLTLCQEPVVFTEKIQKGVYRTFNEFKANRPSIRDSFEISVADTRALIPADNSILLIDSIGNKKRVTGPVWGFSDGNNFYIYAKGFHQLHKPGGLSVFEIEPILMSSGKEGATSGNRTEKSGSDFIINFKNGQIVKASENNILKLLSDDPELYIDFRKNGSRELVYMYVERYNKKHPIVYPGIVLSGTDFRNSKPESFPENSLYLEIPGSSYLIGSVNYERLSVRSGIFYLMSRFGIGYGRFDEKNLISFPLMMNGVFQLTNKFALEVGVGGTLMYQFWNEKQNAYTKYPRSLFDPVLTGFAGIRYVREDGLLVRAGFTPLLDVLMDIPVMKNKFTPWFGASLGYVFGN